jgi:broad specificity phosphatase PhoE
MAEEYAAVRHPEKQDDIDHIHRGDASYITPEGERQAEIILQRARLMDIDAIVSSDTPRTALLATKIGAAIGRPTLTSALFREWRAPSILLGHSTKEPWAQELKFLLRESFDLDVQQFDEETKSMLEERTWEGRQFLASLPPKRVLLMSHAKYIAGLVTQTVWGSLDGYYRGPDRRLILDHTGVTIFTKKEDRRDGSVGFAVKSVNDVSHQDTSFFQSIQHLFQTPS